MHLKSGSVGHVRSDNAMCQRMLLLTEIVETLNIIKTCVIYIHFQQNYEFDFIKQAKPTHTCSIFGSLHRTRYSLLSKLTRNQQNMSDHTFKYFQWSLLKNAWRPNNAKDENKWTDANREKEGIGNRHQTQ